MKIKRYSNKRKTMNTDKIRREIDNKTYKQYTHSRNAVFYRCIYCFSKISIDRRTNQIKLVSGHKNCKVYKMKPTTKSNTSTKRVKSNAESVSIKSWYALSSQNDLLKLNIISDLYGKPQPYIPHMIRRRSIVGQNQECLTCNFKIAKVEKPDLKLFVDSFEYALKKKNLVFNEDLRFPIGKFTFPSTYLKDIQTLSDYNQAKFEEFKTLCRKKIYAPLIIEEDPDKGFIVKTTQPLLSLTLIAEYSGLVLHFDVDDMKEEDSLMEYATFLGNSFVIQPRPFCNIARFISGINNFNNQQKKNLESMKFRDEKGIHILLYTSRKNKER